MVSSLLVSDTRSSSCANYSTSLKTRTSSMLCSGSSNVTLVPSSFKPPIKALSLAGIKIDVPGKQRANQPRVHLVY